MEKIRFSRLIVFFVFIFFVVSGNAWPEQEPKGSSANFTKTIILSKSIAAAMKPTDKLTKAQAEIIINLYREAHLLMSDIYDDQKLSEKQKSGLLMDLSSSMGRSFLKYSQSSYLEVPNKKSPLQNYSKTPVVINKALRYAENVTTVFARDWLSLAGFESPDGFDFLGLRQRRRSKMLRDIYRQTFMNNDYIVESELKGPYVQAHEEMLSTMQQSRPLTDVEVHRLITYSYVGMAVTFGFIQMPWDWFPQRTNFTSDFSASIWFFGFMSMTWSHYYNQGMNVGKEMGRSALQVIKDRITKGEKAHYASSRCKETFL